MEIDVFARCQRRQQRCQRSTRAPGGGILQNTGQRREHTRTQMQEIVPAACVKVQAKPLGQFGNLACRLTERTQVRPSPGQRLD